MTSAIDVAEKALTVTAGLNKALPAVKATNLQGRSVEHWSCKVLIVGASIGLIAVVVFAILNAIPAAVISGILLTTNVLGAFYLHRFRLYDQLETYVKEMANRIDLFGGRITELKEANNNLDVIEGKMDKIPEKWKIEVDKGKKELMEVHKKFEVLKKNYDNVLVKLAKFSTISKTLQAETGTLAKETVKFNDQNKFLGDNIKIISDSLETFQKYNTDISNRSKELDSANQELDRVEMELDKSLEVIKELFQTVKGLYSQIQKVMDTFEKKIVDLKKTYPDIQASREQIQALNKQILSLKSNVEKLLQRETEIKELREFKESRKVEFEAWKKTRQIK